MTIPRKGRRSIVVDAAEYHYKIAFARSDRIVIQTAGASRSSLFVFPFAIMKPAHVANAIRFGSSCGWQPRRQAADCWLAFDVDTRGDAHFERIPPDDFRVVTYSAQGRIRDNMNGAMFDDTRPWYDRPSPAANAKQPDAEQCHASADWQGLIDKRV